MDKAPMVVAYHAYGSRINLNMNAKAPIEVHTAACAYRTLGKRHASNPKPSDAKTNVAVWPNATLPGTNSTSAILIGSTNCAIRLAAHAKRSHGSAILSSRAAPSTIAGAEAETATICHSSGRRSKRVNARSALIPPRSVIYPKNSVFSCRAPNA